MILTTSGSFDTMVESVTQTVAYELSIDVPGIDTYDATFSASDIEYDASMTTDAPSGTRLQPGYPTAQLTFTLAGNLTGSGGTYTAAALFNAYNASSPLYHTSAKFAPVVLKLGLYPAGSSGVPELPTVFTGTVDTYTCEASAGTVAFSCLDPMTTLRASIDVPAVVTESPYNAGLTSEYAVDALLRAATAGAVSSWPPTRAQCVLSAGMRSSTWPEVGGLSTASSQPIITFAPGLFGTAFSGATVLANGYGLLTYTLAGNIGTALYVEWFQPDQTSGTDTQVSVGQPGNLSEGITLERAGDVFTLTIFNSSGNFAGNVSWTAPANSGAYTSFLVTPPGVGGTAYSVTFGAGSTLHATSTTSAYSRTTLVWNTATVSLGGGTIEALQITTETSVTLNSGFVPQAVIDPSLNTLQVIPEITGSPADALQAIADAELGVAAFRGDGTFRFRNRQTLSNASNIARTITSTDSLTDLEIEVGAQSYANRVQATYTGWNFGSAGLVWSLDVPQVVRSGRTRSFTATIDTDGETYGADIDASVSVLTNGHSTTDGGSYYRASTDKAGTTERTGGVKVTVGQVSASQVVVTVANTGSQDAWLVSPSNYTDVPVGTPSLWIGGIPVTQGSTLTADTGATADPASEVLYQVPSNDWIQDSDTATELASDTLKMLFYSAPLFTNIGILPDPRLELGDIVHLQDTAYTGMDEYAVIWGNTISLSTSADENGAPQLTYTQSISATPLGPPGAWLLGVPGRSELGTTTYVY